MSDAIAYFTLVALPVVSFFLGKILERNKPSRNYCVRCLSERLP